MAHILAYYSLKVGIDSVYFFGSHLICIQFTHNKSTPHILSRHSGKNDYYHLVQTHTLKIYLGVIFRLLRQKQPQSHDLLKPSAYRIML